MTDKRAGLNILVSTKGDRMPDGLEYAPAHRLMVDTRKGWAASSNALLDAAAETGDDALFLDDDVTLLPSTFADMDRWYSPDTLVGFQLRDGGRIISAGHFLANGAILLPNRDIARPLYMAHVTASAMYIPSAVLRSGARFPCWTGLHSEDVAYTYDVWMRGFKVLYWPSPVLHHVAGNGIGATKTNESDIGARLLENVRALGMWMQEHGALGKVPTGVQAWT